MLHSTTALLCVPATCTNKIVLPVAPDHRPPMTRRFRNSLICGLLECRRCRREGGSSYLIHVPSNEPSRPTGAGRSGLRVHGVLYRAVVNMLLAMLYTSDAASVSFSVPYEARPPHPRGARRMGEAWPYTMAHFSGRPETAICYADMTCLVWTCGSPQLASKMRSAEREREEKKLKQGP